MSEHPVITILSRWPSRRELHEDARAADPKLDLVAVHRWFTRESVNPRHWPALVDGATRRGFGLTVDELMRAHGTKAVAPERLAS